jgi:tripartite-type tricarboxylate transporter receptor subunit TctC
MVAVPYKTPAQMFPDLMQGRIQMLFGSFGQLLPYNASGKMRLLAITRDKRLPNHPEIPAVAETLPGFRVGGIGIIFAPARTPLEITRKLNAELDAIVKDPEYQKRVQAFGFTTLAGAGTPSEIASFTKSERDNWDNVFRSVKIEPQ